MGDGAELRDHKTFPGNGGHEQAWSIQWNPVRETTERPFRSVQDRVPDRTSRSRN
jgi:hypothetical protein